MPAGERTKPLAVGHHVAEERSDEGGSATCLSCLTPRLKSSANLNGWNARMTFKDMKPSNARAV